MTNEFLKKQQELAREEVFNQWPYTAEFNKELMYPWIDTLIQQITTNIGEELMRRVEGEIVQHDKEYDPSGAFSTCLICGDTTSDYCDIPLNHAIDTIKQHITSVTGVE